MKGILAWLSAVVLGYAALGVPGKAAEPIRPEWDKTPQRSPDFMPLGVYWAGELTFGELKDPQERWKKIDQCLDDMAKRGINAIWLTHLSAAETAEFARHAQKRGIYLVASVADLAGEVENVRKSDHPKLIAETLAAWGDAPAPIAWGLGDEPLASYMGEMKTYVDAWHKHAPGEPVTTVVMHGDIHAAGQAGFDAISTDVYPFFSSGNPSHYGMADWAAWTSNVAKARWVSRRPWMMGQSYQEPWGPYEVNEKGNIVYLPGGAPHWVMPSPAQIRWQALAAVAEGGKGMFYFLYRWPVESSATAEACKLPAAVKVRTDSGAPRAMVYPDGRPTPQYDEMGEGFAWINRFASVLAPLQPAAMPEAWLSVAGEGHIARMLVHPKTGKRYLAVVALFGGEAERTIKVTVGPHITALKSLVTGKSLTLATVAPLRETRVTLAPATAELFECTADESNTPSSYSDDFTNDKFAKDALQVQSVRRHGDGVLSAVGGESYEQAFVVYDLEKFLPTRSKGGVRMLLYDSVAAPPDFRGAFWSVSDDGKTFGKLSYNEPGKPVFFTGRYLKVGLSWSQSSAAWAYGALRSFTICQWKEAAK
jgi:hypothetical protein